MSTIYHHQTRKGLQLPLAPIRFLLVALVCAAGTMSATAQQQSSKLRDYTKNKNFDDLTQAEHTAAKQEARTATLKRIRVCADPGNMPMSNDKEEGYQNKIARLLAKSMGGEATFFWRPYLERGVTRQTFANDECDILIDMPVGGLQSILTTNPIYRSTYVMAWRNDSGFDFKSLDDPKLKELKIGVYQHSGMREAFSRRGFGEDNMELHVISHMADLRPEEQPWRQVQKVIDKQLDVAAVWGPFAGWLPKMKGEPLTIRPVNMMEDKVPMEFELAIGMRQTNVLLKYMIDWALDRNKDEIAKILADYGVPLVECSRCTVQGDLPSHGTYYEKLRGLAHAEDRYLKQSARLAHTEQATADQIVTDERVTAWLNDGADLNDELGNAIIGNDAYRVALLIEKGADVSYRDSNGYAPLHSAARNRNGPLVELLAKHKADVNAPDADGYAPIFYAAARNHVPTIETLVKLGANADAKDKNGITPLVQSLSDGRYYAAKALIDRGANVNLPAGADGITPLMAVATQLTAQTRQSHVTQGPAPSVLADELIKKGADVNAVTQHGVTALMIAAGHNNAPMIGLLLRAGADPALKSKEGKTALDIAQKALHDDAIGALKFLTKPARTGPGQPAPAPAQN
jgi:quinoprotein dehydrogenase-associated probable ABC transporter substrate-binding protein